MKQYLIIIFSMIAFFSNAITGSDSLKTQGRRPLVISVGTHAASFPLYNKPLTYRINPGMVIGTEFTHKKGQHFRFYQTANLGTFHHKFMGTSVFVNTDVALGYTTGFGLYADVLLGVGYLHTFRPRKVFAVKNEEFEQVTDWGKPSFMIPLSVELGYKIKGDKRFSVSPFVMYKWFAQVPNNKSIPVMSHLLLTIGTKIYFGGK